jgi:crotonobetainyl-CoA:carnitine CoA-transferase CaiB-like acyl-CoA transferase
MQPLTGVRVLDLTRLLPGPFATLVLADLGAQVDKIEDAGQGDYTRQLGVPQVAGMSAAFFKFDTGDGVVHQYRTPVTPRDLEARPAPTQGQHTDQVLGDAGFAAAEIAELRASGAIR